MPGSAWAALTLIGQRNFITDQSLKKILKDVLLIEEKEKTPDEKPKKANGLAS